jgi:ribonuclease D
MTSANQSDHTWVRDERGVQELVARMHTAPWVALDTESNSMFVYRERMCLLQLNLGGELVLVDSLALAGEPPATALAALAPELARADRPLWLHGGEYDVGIFRRDFGMRLEGIWDTQQAALMLGWEKTGYGAVVERVCGVSLEKSHTQYNWATRPLDPGAERYAVDDVRYLPEVGTALQQAVRDADLEEEMAIACAAVGESAWNGGFDAGGFWKIKGVRELRPHQQSVLAALWSWRDEVSRELDQPPGRLMNGELLLAIARNQPTNFQLLKRIGVRGSLLGSNGESLIECIRAAASDPKPLPPRPRAREVLPIEEEREVRLKDWRRSEATRRTVPLQAVLPAKALEWLKQHGAADLAQVPQLGGKRIRLYGEQLQRLCDAGRS